jgi:hypothetical protein
VLLANDVRRCDRRTVAADAGPSLNLVGRGAPI